VNQPKALVVSEDYHRNYSSELKLLSNQWRIQEDALEGKRDRYMEFAQK
jgi:hypothetical protein